MGLLAAACSPAEGDLAASVVTVFGPYRDQEAASFSASLAPFEERTGIDVRYVGTGSIARQLPDRIAEGDPPDVALVPQPAVVADLVDQGLIVPLGPVAADAVRSNYTPAAIDLMTFDGVPYGVLYRVSLKSLVWYPPSEFAERGYDVPRTWDELLDLTRAMESDGFQPWCFAIESFDSTGWVGTDWVEDLMLRRYGSEDYLAWVRGDILFDDARVRDAFELFGEIVLTPGRVYGGIRRALGVNWTEAAAPMFTDPPGCLLHHQASFYRTSLPDDIEIGGDVDVFVLPPLERGDAAPLVTAGDLAVAFDDRPEVQALLSYLATPESGVAWAKAGGYTSPHATFDPSDYGDAFDRRIGEVLLSKPASVAFDASDQMPPAVGTGTFWEGIVLFLQTGDLDAAVTEIQEGYSP